MDIKDLDFDKLAEYMYHTFNTESGKKILVYFDNVASQSVLSGSPMMDAQTSVNPAEFVFMREGNNQVIRYIKQLINHYKENRNG